jgi:hypothetical protein
MKHRLMSVESSTPTTARIRVQNGIPVDLLFSLENGQVVFRYSEPVDGNEMLTRDQLHVGRDNFVVAIVMADIAMRRRTRGLDDIHLDESRARGWAEHAFRYNAKHNLNNPYGGLVQLAGIATTFDTSLVPFVIAELKKIIGDTTRKRARRNRSAKEKRSTRAAKVAEAAARQPRLL